jgi:2-polyprenyl-3-methyl-5-hydroxy-6-metoxy-1,4-benzoquinol methylase
MSAISSIKIHNCPLCQHGPHTTYSQGYDYELETCDNLWTFVQCSSCSFVFLNPRPALTELSTIYPSHYYSYDMSQKLPWFILKGKEILDRLKLGSILNHAQHIKSYLDIGCGDGRYLRTVEASKNISKENLYGLELDDHVVSELKKQGYQAFCERIENAPSLDQKKFDLITMFHVIEHVEDPLVVIRNIKNLLNSKGILVIETPNINSLDAKIFKKTYWGGYHIPRHWHLFSDQTLKQLLQQEGFDILKASYQTGHSFWLYSIHHYLKYGTQKKFLKKLSVFFDPMKSKFFLILFTLFDKLRSITGFKTSAILIIAQKQD